MRGVAMLLVLIGLAVLTLVTMDIRKNSVVELRLSTNKRDELRAFFLAESGLGFSRLLLRFQKQLDAIQLPNIQGLLSALSGAGGASGASAGLLSGLLGGAGATGLLSSVLGGQSPGAFTPSALSIQLWRMAKVDCQMLQQLVPEAKSIADTRAASSPSLEFDSAYPELAAAQRNRNFGTFQGCFHSTITDEEERLNVAKLGAPQLTAQTAVSQMLTLFGDERFRFVFQREDANHIKVTPSDVVLAIRDWIDDDNSAAQLNTTGQGNPFFSGFSDEGSTYQRYNPAYKVKNARFDSLDELYMVYGIGDTFMAAFGDRLTIYPDVNSRLNINSNDPVLLELAIRSIADPLRPDPRLRDPLFIDTLVQKLRAARVINLFGLGVSDFVGIVASTGLALNQIVLGNLSSQRLIGDKSTTYRISVQGESGDVVKTITAVVRLDDGLGRLLYWREN